MPALASVNMRELCIATRDGLMSGGCEGLRKSDSLLKIKLRILLELKTVTL